MLDPYNISLTSKSGDITKNPVLVLTDISLKILVLILQTFP